MEISFNELQKSLLDKSTKMEYLQRLGRNANTNTEILQKIRTALEWDICVVAGFNQNTAKTRNHTNAR